MSADPRNQVVSTFHLRRRTPGSFLLVPCPRQGRSIRCQVRAIGHKQQRLLDRCAKDRQLLLEDAPRLSQHIHHRVGAMVTDNYHRFSRCVEFRANTQRTVLAELGHPRFNQRVLRVGFAQLHHQAGRLGGQATHVIVRGKKVPRFLKLMRFTLSYENFTNFAIHLVDWHPCAPYATSRSRISLVTTG